MPTYKSAREFKGVANTHGLPLNAIAFTSVFSYIMGLCLIRLNLFLQCLGVVLLAVTSVFTGSRAPIGVLIISVFGLVLLNLLRDRRLWARFLGYLGAAAVVAAILFILIRVPFKTMTDATEGRWDLWSVAVDKFEERPLVGYGFESWRDDLVSRLPGEYEMTSNIALTIAGGYHNEYLTMLAEQGLIGTAPILALFGFVLALSWKLAFRRWKTWDKGQWALFGCLFLMLRGAVEMPGLFGYAQDPSDYLAWLFVALLVSRFSMEEDGMREAAVQSVNHGASVRAVKQVPA
jgi:O-antigen ligase